MCEPDAAVPFLLEATKPRAAGVTAPAAGPLSAPSDPLTFGAATASMLVVALIAAWLPARRALKLDPAEALRTE